MFLTKNDFFFYYYYLTLNDNKFKVQILFYWTSVFELNHPCKIDSYLASLRVYYSLLFVTYIVSMYVFVSLAKNVWVKKKKIIIIYSDINNIILWYTIIFYTVSSRIRKFSS